MFPSWRYHRELGGRVFADPKELEQAGPGWHESPADVGLTPEAPVVPGDIVHHPSPVLDEDDPAIATLSEQEESAAKAAKRAARASIPTSPAGRARAVASRAK